MGSRCREKRARDSANTRAYGCARCSTLHAYRIALSERNSHHFLLSVSGPGLSLGLDSENLAFSLIGLLLRFGYVSTAIERFWTKRLQRELRCVGCSAILAVDPPCDLTAPALKVVLFLLMPRDPHTRMTCTSQQFCSLVSCYQANHPVTASGLPTSSSIADCTAPRTISTGSYLDQCQHPTRVECECLDVGRAGTDDLPAWAESGLAPPTLAVSADPDWEGDQALAQETHSATSVAPSLNKDRQLHWFCDLGSRLTNVRLTHMLLVQLFLTRHSLLSRGFALALPNTRSHSRTHSRTHSWPHTHSIALSLSLLYSF